MDRNHTNDMPTSAGTASGGSWGVSSVIDEQSLRESCKRIGSRIFLNGDEIETERWMPVVERLHNAIEQPNRVIVLAHLEKRDWNETNRLRRSIVAAGGILEEMSSSSFETAIEDWVRSLDGSSAEHHLAPEKLPDRPASGTTWDLYRGSFVTDEELREFTDLMAQDVPASKSSVS